MVARRLLASKSTRIAPGRDTRFRQRARIAEPAKHLRKIPGRDLAQVVARDIFARISIAAFVRRRPGVFFPPCARPQRGPAHRAGNRTGIRIARR